MEYYHDLVTQKSWQALVDLKKKVNFVLLGGWAVFLYSHSLKSKDIDLCLDYGELSQIKKYYPLFKNDRLKKYEAKKGPVEIDIYLPHYSQIGIPIGDLIANSQSHEGFQLAEINYLFCLKVYTFCLRRGSVKGQKDFLDLISLIKTNSLDYHKLLGIIKKYELVSAFDIFKNYLRGIYEVGELQLSRHHFSRLKKEFLIKI